MTLNDVMSQERTALLSESIFKSPWGTQLLPYAAVTSPEILQRTPEFLRSAHPVVLTELAGRDRRMAFVQICPTLRYKFLWVHADNDDYRTDYKNYLRQHQHVTEAVPRSLHADHLYNRERAKRLGTPFIRLVLCKEAINTSHGAGIEKKRTRNGLGAYGREHKMDDIILLKLCGLPSPRTGQPLTPEMLAHIQAIAPLYGMEPGEIQASIQDLIDVANFIPSGNGA
jgi:hypothetical protein